MKMGFAIKPELLAGFTCTPLAVGAAPILTCSKPLLMPGSYSFSVAIWLRAIGAARMVSTRHFKARHLQFRQASGDW